MKTVTHINEGKEYLQIGDLPETASDFKIDFWALNPNSCHFRYSDRGRTPGIELPLGQWKLLGKASDLTEGQAKHIVEFMYKDGSLLDIPSARLKFYRNYGPSGLLSVQGAIKSLQSLCQSHGLTPDETVILQKL